MAYENEGYVDYNFVQIYKVYVDGRYVGTVQGSDVIATTKIAIDRFFVRTDQNVTLKPATTISDEE